MDIAIFRKMVADERSRQLTLWGEQNHSKLKWIVIILEELGECAKACLEQDRSALIKELVQVVAVIETFIEKF